MYFKYVMSVPYAKNDVTPSDVNITWLYVIYDVTIKLAANSCHAGPCIDWTFEPPTV